MIVTTTHHIDGAQVDSYLGIVTAQTVLGVNAFKDMAAGLRNVFGGRSKSYEGELEGGVTAVLVELEQKAAALQADAVIAVDIDYGTVGQDMLMVSASGTAVRLATRD
ncbi:YbjQ family protein [Saccharothrix deserti]|uniref:YbjQ family protein n=1 Tax=Saccharothrix deserti TaxID=2593674 RepID=UPI00131B9183|nr:YbjQ family protein [Saccharothrix deserti]